MTLRRTPPCPEGTVMYNGALTAAISSAIQSTKTGSVILTDGAGCEESLPETTSAESLMKNAKNASEKCQTYFTLRILKYFLDKGYSVNKACAIAGNAMFESEKYKYAQKVKDNTK